MSTWLRDLLWRWRYLYARPLFPRQEVMRFIQLREGGAEQYADRVLYESIVWRPWWRRRDGSLLWRRRPEREEAR